jgi:hypothetical protein
VEYVDANFGLAAMQNVWDEVRILTVWNLLRANVYWYHSFFTILKNRSDIQLFLIFSSVSGNLYSAFRSAGEKTYQY